MAPHGPRAVHGIDARARRGFRSCGRTSGRELAREQLTTPTRTPVLGDLDPALALVARQASDPARALSFARSMGLETRSSSVRVTLRTTSPQAASAAVDAAGGAVEGTYESLVQALVPPAALAALAAQPEILRVERPATFVSAAVSGEGIRTIDAADSHAGGFNGAGISIAVFDTGFANLLAQQDAGELPGSLTTRSFCADGYHAGGTHGTAVAEIVHEVAPAAELHLVCINTVVDLGRAKDYAIENGIDVINMSGGFYIRGDGNGTGTGTFATLPDGIAKQARDSGIVWVNAAGNEALRHCGARSRIRTETASWTSPRATRATRSPSVQVPQPAPTPAGRPGPDPASPPTTTFT